MTVKAIERKVFTWVQRQGLLTAGDTVLLALSGGADSLCLARVLLALRGPLPFRLFAAHYNHQLRGEASEQDEAFVRQFCKTFHLPLTLGRGDVADEARRMGRGIEETARDMRYAFLEATARDYGANAIATGHHADDNVETILLNLTRGAGLRGLSGIPPRRGRIVRPLLSIQREEIVEYLADLKQDFVEDATNEDTNFRRNALRHQILPLLREMNPSLTQTIARQSERLRQDSAYLDKLAAETFAKLIGHDTLDLPTANLTALDPAIATRVLTLAVKAAGGEADTVHIQQILALVESPDPSAETQVRGGLTVRRMYDRLVFEPTINSTPSFELIILPETGEVFLPEIGLRITISDHFQKKQGPFHTFLFQQDAVCGKITVRPRQRGDSIRLQGRSGTKTIKKLMIEAKIPAKERETWPIFADEAGVIAVYKLGIAERVAPVSGDKNKILTIVVGEEKCTKT